MPYSDWQDILGRPSANISKTQPKVHKNNLWCFELQGKRQGFDLNFYQAKLFHKNSHRVLAQTSWKFNRFAHRFYLCVRKYFFKRKLVTCRRLETAHLKDAQRLIFNFIKTTDCQTKFTGLNYKIELVIWIASTSWWLCLINHRNC